MKTCLISTGLDSTTSISKDFSLLFFVLFHLNKKNLY